MKEILLNLDTDESVKHYKVNGSDLSLSTPELEVHLETIASYLSDVRAGRRENPDTIILDSVIARRDEIRAEVKRRQILAGIRAVGTRVRECLDVADW